MQLFNILDEHNRFKIGAGVTAPWNAPPAGAEPTMDGFVTDYISTFTGEVGRQPTYDEYRQIMTGYTPEQVPVLNGLARDFTVFDHWFCEVPSQTLMNRSFWTAATSSGFTVNSPASNYLMHNDAETLFERLEARGKTWKVYVMEPDPVSFTALIHMPRLKDRFATNFVPFAEFEKDAAAGTLPDFSLIEPNLVAGHADYHPASGRSFIGDDVDVPLDPPSSILAGDAFLERIYNAYRSMDSAAGSNVFNTTLFIGWDEPGGTYDHVAPGPIAPPDPAAPPGQCDFTFDRSGYRVPAIIVSPWVESGSVQNEDYRHTSMIATCASSGTSAIHSPAGMRWRGPSTVSSPSTFRATPTLGRSWRRGRCRSTTRTSWPSFRVSRRWARLHFRARPVRPSTRLGRAGTAHGA